MEQTLQNTLLTRRHVPQITLAGGMRCGLIAGLAGTMVMDLVLMGTLAAIGLPTLTCFSIVGDTVEQLFSNLGIYIAGGVPMGIAAHYLVGPLFGLIFGSLLAKVDVLRVNTLKKGIVLAVIYVEIISQPILATTPILLKMTVKDTLLWFGASFVMHFLYGLVLGAIVSYGLHLTKSVRQASHVPGSFIDIRGARPPHPVTGIVRCVVRLCGSHSAPHSNRGRKA